MTAPLGKNIGGYGGDTIDIDDVLQRTLAAAQAHGWSIENFPNTGELKLYGLRRLTSDPRLAIYISTGIHGDEPAGPLTMLELIQANDWPSGVNLFVCPCLNPTGFQKNTRENQDGVDLNRDYRYIKTCEVQTHTKWIDSLPTFDFGICLHEDWEARGFYLYELNPDNLPAVSKNVTSSPSITTLRSTTSRVVPGVGLTRARV